MLAVGTLPCADTATAAVRDALSTAEEHQQKSLLRMHPVLSLIEDDRLWPIEHGIRHLRVTMRGEAVHEDCILLRMSHQHFIHLVRLEDGCPFRRLVLEAHTGAHVRIHGISTRNCLDGVLHQRDAATRQLAYLDRLVNNVKLGCEALRRSDTAVRTQLSSRKHERMTDIIAIAHIRKVQSLSGAKALFQGEEIRNSLTGMLKV